MSTLEKKIREEEQKVENIRGQSKNRAKEYNKMITQKEKLKLKLAKDIEKAKRASQ